MDVQVLPDPQPDPAPRRLHNTRHVPFTQAEPGWQSSGSVEHFAPTALSCKVAQSQTVLSVLAMGARPARNTQPKPARGLPHAALPMGLQFSMGGEQRKRLSSGWLFLSRIVLAVHRLLLAQSASVRQVR